jgi:alkylhydroperoxidase family enzyme
VTGATGNTLIFDRVVYRPAQGFPIENELIVNTTSAENCCIACQNTVSHPTCMFDK